MIIMYKSIHVAPIVMCKTGGGVPDFHREWVGGSVTSVVLVELGGFMVAR
jgi:hypothetical protein